MEDDPDVLASLREMALAHYSDRVLVAADGREGLERALAERPDLILLDLELPRLHGLALLRQLRERGLDVAVIVLTVHRS